MSLRGGKLALVAGVLVLAAIGTQLALGKKKEKSPGAKDEQKRAVHALNRLAFGPRPGDVERVAQMGVDKWIELQLRPEKIDDSALDSRLAPFRTLRMDTRELVENFPPNQVIKQVAEGKADLPRDPVKRAIFEAQLQRLDDKKERKEEAAKSGSDVANPSGTGDASKPSDQEVRRREDRVFANLKTQ